MDKGVLLNIAKYLPYHDLMSLCTTDRYYNMLCANINFWKIYVAERFGYTMNSDDIRDYKNLFTNSKSRDDFVYNLPSKKFHILDSDIVFMDDLGNVRIFNNVVFEFKDTNIFSDGVQIINDYQTFIGGNEYSELVYINTNNDLILYNITEGNERVLDREVMTAYLCRKFITYNKRNDQQYTMRLTTLAKRKTRYNIDRIMGCDDRGMTPYPNDLNIRFAMYDSYRQIIFYITRSGDLYQDDVLIDSDVIKFDMSTNIINQPVIYCYLKNNGNLYTTYMPNEFVQRDYDVINFNVSKFSNDYKVIVIKADYE